MPILRFLRMGLLCGEVLGSEGDLRFCGRTGAMMTGSRRVVYRVRLDSRVRRW